MPTSSPLLSFESLNQTLYLALPFTGLIYAEKKRPHSSNLLNSPKDLALAPRREGGWVGSQTRGKRKKKKEPSTIKTMSSALSNLGSFQGWGNAFPQWIPPFTPSQAVFTGSESWGVFNVPLQAEQ
jgi:hypothetical protein